MPESKKRQSPVVGHNKVSKHGIASEHDRPSITTPEIPDQASQKEAEKTPEKIPTPPPPLPDIMKTEPILFPYIVDVYEGEVDENGFYHGNGCAKLKGGVCYDGLFVHSKMHGHGTIIWPNGTTFTGDIDQNSITGKGIYTWPDGSSYDGETCNSLRHGFGIFKCADGIKSYAGQWAHGKRNGKGVMYYDDIGASYYDGEWLNNQKNGNGIRRFKNGNVYEGEWVNNIREGEGTMRWYDLGQEYRGSWKDGLQNGNGENTCYLKRVNTTQYPLRNYYVGNFLNGERQGYGTFHYASGASYEGEWKSNMKHGGGKFTFKNGYIFTGKFRDDHMIDFPELILSGMTTPDIARIGIPVKSPGPMRAESIMGVPTKGNDVFLDVDIEEILMDYSYDLERRQDEVDNILRLLLRHTTQLKQLYKIYSCLGQNLTIDKTTLMTKLQFFRFLKDYSVHKLGYPVMELERLLGEDPNEQDYCYRKIFLRDFLGSLIRISHIVFKDEIYEDMEYPISACFNLFLQCLLVPPETVQINGYVFTSVQKCQEALKHLKLFIDIYYHFSASHLKKGEYALTQRHLVFIFDELGLLSNDLTTSKLVDIITKEDKEEEDYFNLEMMVSPLEFIEVIVGSACAFVSTEVLRKHQCLSEEEVTKSEVIPEVSSTADQSVSENATNNVNTEGANNNNEGDQTESNTKATSQNQPSLTTESISTNAAVQSSKISTTNSSSKLASKGSKKGKSENRKMDRENSKEHTSNSGGKSRDKKTLKTEDSKSPSNTKRRASNVEPPQTVVVNEEASTTLKEIKEEPKENTTPQTSATEIPTNESTETTGNSTKITDASETIPELLSLDHFEGWSTKLNIFIEHYLKPAYEKSLIKHDSQQTMSDQLCLYVSTPNTSVMKYV